MPCTVSALMTRACTSGIGKIFSKVKLLQLIAQLKTICGNQLIYTQSNGAVTTINNPTGAYNLTAINPKIVSIVCRNAPNITSLTLTDDALLTSLDLQNCAALKTLNFSRCTALTSVNLNTFTSVTNLLFEDCNAITSFTATNLVTVTADFNLRGTAAVIALTGAFSLPALTTVGGVFYVYANAFSTLLTSVSLPALTSVGGTVIVANYTNVTSISAPNLASVGMDFNLKGCAALTIASFNNLVSVGGNLFLHDNTSMTQLSLSSLASCDNIASYGCTLLSSVNLASLSSCSTINFNLCTALGSFSLPSMVAALLSEIDFSSCSSLTSYSHGTIRFGGGGNLLWINAALDVTSVNAILVGADAAAVVAAVIDLSGGTNAAPTGAGIVAKADLILNGNTVTTN